MLRTILFDMGNVLVHFSHDLMCRQMAALAGRSEADVRRLILDGGLQWNFERGLVSARQFHAEFESLVEQRVDFDELMHANANIFCANRELFPAIDELKQRGFRLVLLSNTSSAHFDFIWREFDVLQKFDDHVVSYEVGALKPERKMYVAALQAIDCAPDECFYTDDIPAYVEAGRRYGLQAEVFTTPGECGDHLAARGVKLQSLKQTERRASA